MKKLIFLLCASLLMVSEQNAAQHQQELMSPKAAAGKKFERGQKWQEKRAQSMSNLSADPSKAIGKTVQGRSFPGKSDRAMLNGACQLFTTFLQRSVSAPTQTNPNKK